MADKSYIHKKRIVYTALSPFFSGENLMKAMVIWDKKYAHYPSTAVQQFVYDLKTGVDEQADIRGAHLNLIRMASAPLASLLGDPSSDIELYLGNSKKKTKVKSVAPELEAFQLLITHWQDQLDPKSSRSLSIFVMENIYQQNINHALSMWFLSWLNNEKKEAYFQHVKLSELRKITNLYYVGCCEIIGPVKTDRILGASVQAFNSIKYNEYEVYLEKLL